MLCQWSWACKVQPLCCWPCWSMYQSSQLPFLSRALFSYLIQITWNSIYQSIYVFGNVHIWTCQWCIWAWNNDNIIAWYITQQFFPGCCMTWWNHFMVFFNICWCRALCQCSPGLSPGWTQQMIPSISLSRDLNINSSGYFCRARPCWYWCCSYSSCMQANLIGCAHDPGLL